jgi:hypothetical protein
MEPMLGEKVHHGIPGTAGNSEVVHRSPRSANGVDEDHDFRAARDCPRVRGLKIFFEDI